MGRFVDREATEPIRILLCVDHLPPSDGGVEQVVEQLAHRLTDRGHEVGVFTLRGPDENIELCNHSDARVFTSNKIDLTGYIGLQSTVSISALRDFWRAVRQFHPDVVHVHNRFFYTAYVGLLYKYVDGYPLVTTLHLGELEHIDGAGGVAARLFQAAFARRLARASNAVICVSDAVATVARSLGATDPLTVPNAVDLDRFDVKRSEFDKTLLYVGRLVRNNGPDDLVRAVPHIVNEHPDAHVHIVGSGNLEPELTRLVDSLSVSESVTIHGFVDDLLPLYEAADVFCRPSYSEGLPLTLLESMATYSVPVVTPVAGAQEVLSDGETGYFVDVNDPMSIATTINRLFYNPATVNRLADSAREYVERRHSWDQRIEDVIRVYDDLNDIRHDT